mgnify:CR=1 FL=1
MDLLFPSLGLYALGMLAMLCTRRMKMTAHYAGMLLATAGSALLTGASAFYLFDGRLGTVKLWSLGQYSLAADSWSVAFLLLLGLAGTATSIYAMDYAKAYREQRICVLSGLWNLFLLSMAGVLLAADALTFLVFWEIMALASFLLVNHEGAKKLTAKAAYQYMVMTHLGTGAIFIAFFLLASGADSLSFASLSASTVSAEVRTAVFVAAFLGFALKSGLMPLHVWLPVAHPAAPSHVSALMSGVMLKMAVYGMGRFLFDFLGSVALWQGILVMFCGLLSAFLGVLYACMEKDMKRSLAYSSVENMGIIFAAIGCGMVLQSLDAPQLAALAFTAVLVHSFSHSMMKSLLFMSAGAVMHATGSKNLEQLGALARYMPVTALFTLVGAMSLSSLPFTSGLVGEWMVLQSMMALAWQAGTQGWKLIVILAFVLLGLTGALALGCFVRMYGMAFLGRARSKIVQKAKDAPFFMKAGMGLEAAGILLFGLFPAPVVELLKGEAGRLYAVDLFQLLPLFLLLLVLGLLMKLLLSGRTVTEERDITWNCGTIPTRRQQYSAIGFTKPLRRAFDMLLKPRKERTFLQKEHRYFGNQAAYQFYLPDRFKEKLYHPVETVMIRAASMIHAVQQGSVRLYIGYTMAAMIAVLVWGVR